jgi:drug/metabolite transporter (DMT)-like permease
VIDAPVKRPLAGSLAVLAAVGVWGGVAVVARLVDEIDGLVLGMHRLWIGAVMTLLVFSVRGGRLSWRLMRLCLPGGLAFALDIAMFFSALKHTTVANATVIGALQPALLMLVVGRLFGERVTREAIVWTVVAIGGVGLVVFGSSGAPVWSPFGDLLATGALFAWTWYFVASRQARRDLSALEFLVGMTLVAAIALTPAAMLSGNRIDPGSVGDWAWIAVLAVGSGGLGHLLISWAHDHIDLSVMSLLTLAVPVVATLSAALFLDEPLVAVQLVGLAVVLGALGLVVLRSVDDRRVDEGLELAPEVEGARRDELGHEDDHQVLAGVDPEDR